MDVNWYVMALHSTFIEMTINMSKWVQKSNHILSRIVGWLFWSFGHLQACLPARGASSHGRRRGCGNGQAPRKPRRENLSKRQLLAFSQFSACILLEKKWIHLYEVKTWTQEVWETTNQIKNSKNNNFLWAVKNSICVKPVQSGEKDPMIL